ncbi:rhodanese-like domain-containing protein [Sedimenticola sp.]|uniref:rhodanese-like domain-containing protein n=1 Tax=Sedimenticola sp. TaxID=1940285 RepID=UPI003D13C890
MWILYAGGRKVLWFGLWIFISFVILNNSAAIADSSDNAHQVVNAKNSSTRTASKIKLPYSCNQESVQNSGFDSDIPLGQEPYWDIPEGRDSKQCIVWLRNIRSAWLNNSIKIIDVRSPQAYQEAHIPGSINIQEYAIRTKAYLKSERLLLVNDGQNYDSIVNTCLRLKKSGFRDVSVMAGGVSLWVNSGETIAIDPNSPRASGNTISPRNLMLSKDQSPWLFLTDSENIASVKKAFHSDYVLSLSLSFSELSSRIQSLEAELDSRMPINIVVVTADGKKKPKISIASEAYKVNSVFFLQGGLIGYEQYLSNHDLQLAKREQGPLIHQRCKI